MSLLGDQLVVPRGGNAHFLPLQEYDRGNNRTNRTNEQTQTMLGVNSREEGELCNTLCMCRLTLAWVTSETSTNQLECRHLDSIFFHSSGPHLLPLVSPLRCPVSTAPVRGSTPTACQLLSPTNSLLASRYLFRPRRDFKSKNPLSGFAPKQTKESSAWRATYIVLHKKLIDYKREISLHDILSAFHVISVPILSSLLRQ